MCINIIIIIIQRWKFKMKASSIVKARSSIHLYNFSPLVSRLATKSAIASKYPASNTLVL